MPAGPLFLSYRQSDGTAIALRIAWQLRAAGLCVWQDRSDLVPGDTTRRLEEALASGLSGAVLVVTPEIADSEVVRVVELPALLLMEETSEFALAIANATNASPADFYAEPDRLLRQSHRTLGRFQQSRIVVGRVDQSLVAKLLDHRANFIRERVAQRGGLMTIDVQTRSVPKASDFDRADLVIRLEPSSTRLPSASGLVDFAAAADDFQNQANALRASRIQVSGGAHLTVAIALGASLPATGGTSLEVIDRSGIWVAPNEAVPNPVRAAALFALPSRARHNDLFVFVDLLAAGNRRPWRRLLRRSGVPRGDSVHVRRLRRGHLSPLEGARVAATVAHLIRRERGRRGDATLHLVFAGPFPVAVMLGRLLNTIPTVLYELDQANGVDNYVASMKVVASSGAGISIEALIVP